LALIRFLSKRHKQKNAGSSAAPEAASAAPAVVAAATTPSGNQEEKMPWTATAVPYTPQSPAPVNGNMPPPNWSGMAVPPMQQQPDMAPPYNNPAFPKQQMPQQQDPYAMQQQYGYPPPGMPNMQPQQLYPGVQQTPSPITPIVQPVAQPAVQNVSEMPSSGTGVAPELSGQPRHEMS
jgi:hypothetical protein